MGMLLRRHYEQLKTPKIVEKPIEDKKIVESEDRPKRGRKKAEE